MATLREEKKQLTRQAIMEASRRLFTAHGYEKTSITDIANAAGVGKGTIYSYFSTKEEIFLAFSRAQLFQQNILIAQSETGAESAYDKMMAVFSGTFHFMEKEREFGRLLMRESFFPEEKNLEQSRKVEDLYIEALIPIMEQAQLQGELSKDLDLLLVIGHFYGLFLITMSAWFSQRLTTKEEFFDTLQRLIEQAMNGLAPLRSTENTE